MKNCLKITQNVEFWHFPPIFVLLKLACLVTLFFQKLAKMNHYWHFNELLSTQNENLARFARNVLNETFLMVFKHRVGCGKYVLIGISECYFY